MSFAKAGFEQSIVERNCNDISIIQKEMKAKGIPITEIGVDMVAQKHIKEKAYKNATSGENAGNIDDIEANEEAREESENTKHLKSSERKAQKQAK